MKMARKKGKNKQTGKKANGMASPDTSAAAYPWQNPAVPPAEYSWQKQAADTAVYPWQQTVVKKEPELKEEPKKEELKEQRQKSPHDSAPPENKPESETRRLIEDVEAKRKAAMETADRIIAADREKRAQQKQEETDKALNNIAFFFRHLAEMPAQLEQRQTDLLNKKLSEVLQKISHSENLATDETASCLVQFIQDSPRRDFREKTVSELGLLGYRTRNEKVAKHAVDCLLAVLGNKNETDRLRLETAGRLKQIGLAWPGLLGPIAGALETAAQNDKNMAVRKQSLSALSDFGAKRSGFSAAAAAHLKNFIEKNNQGARRQKSPSLRKLAFVGLESIATAYPADTLDIVFETIKTVLETDGDQAVRLTAVTCLGALKAQTPQQQRTKLTMMQKTALSDVNAGVRKAALTALDTVRRHHEESVLSIRGTFEQAARNDKDNEVRICAVSGLGRIGLLPDHAGHVRKLFGKLAGARYGTPEPVKKAIAETLKSMNQEWTETLRKKADILPRYR